MKVLEPSLTGAPWAALPSDCVKPVGNRFESTAFAVPTTSAPLSGEVAGLTVVGPASFSADAAEGTVLDVCQPAGKWSLSEPPVPAEATWLSAGALGAALCELGATRKPMAAPITMATAARAAIGPRRDGVSDVGRAAATGVGMGSGVGVGSGSATGSGSAATGSGATGSGSGSGSRLRFRLGSGSGSGSGTAATGSGSGTGSGSVTTGSGGGGGGGCTGAMAAGA